jgi:hypothetical protein
MAKNNVFQKAVFGSFAVERVASIWRNWYNTIGLPD